MARVTRIDPTTRSEIEKKKVCAYCRVSRSTADQLNSYARQIMVYTDLIKRNPGWQLVEIFADEGITGTSAAKRPEFQRMTKTLKTDLNPSMQRLKNSKTELPSMMIRSSDR